MYNHKNIYLGAKRGPSAPGKDNDMLLSPSDVLEKIDPVDPDNLQRSGHVWTAKWCLPVLEGDIEALRRTPGVNIIKEYQPDNLPGWAAIDFTIET